ncbi:MAG: hypothetical protein M0R21_06625 [Lentimicrobiaceae bacterium]|jgi:hypothetical protein|nr:hypothetical protein [Lentimicrobiaceae bacterium]
MKDLLVRKLKMYRNLLAVLFGYRAIWDTSEPFKTEINNLDANMKEIDEKGLSLKGSQSVSEEKKQMCQKMLGAALIVSGIGTAYASQIKDSGLKAKFDFTKSELAKGNEIEIYNRCAGISKAAEPILDKLLAYNMPANQLTILNQYTSAFDELISAPREVRKADKSIRKEMLVLYDECDTLLDERLDKMMLIYKESHPDFYLEYSNARVIGGWHKKNEEVGDAKPPV